MQNSVRQAASVASKVVIAHAGMNARTVALWTAQEQKFFAKYGIDAQVIFIRQAPILLAGMSAGNVQIAATGGTSALLGASGGMDLKVVASLNGRVTYDLVAATNIKSVKELRGKRFDRFMRKLDESGFISRLYSSYGVK